MTCRTCGEPLVEGAAFCTNCGTRTPLPTSSSEGRQTTELGERPTPRYDAPADTQLWHTAPTVVVPQSPAAIVSLVFAILGLVQVLPLIGPIVALIAGHRAQREIDQAGGQLRGRGLARAGLIIGYITLGLYALACVAIVLVFGLLIV